MEARLEVRAQDGGLGAVDVGPLAISIAGVALTLGDRQLHELPRGPPDRRPAVRLLRQCVD